MNLPAFDDLRYLANLLFALGPVAFLLWFGVWWLFASPAEREEVRKDAEDDYI